MRPRSQSRDNRTFVIVNFRLAPQWGAQARVDPLWFTRLWAILSLFFLISLRGTQSLRNSGCEVPDALNSDSLPARRGMVVWLRLDDRNSLS